MPANNPSQKTARPRAILTIPELEQAKAAALATLSHCILGAPTKLPSTNSPPGIALSRGLDSTAPSCCDIDRSSNHSHCQLLRSIFVSPRSAG